MSKELREALEDIVEDARVFDGDTVDELPECFVKQWHIDAARAALAAQRDPLDRPLDKPE